MIPTPYLPVSITQDENKITVYATGREYTFQKTGAFFFTSIKADGEELLDGAIKVKCIEKESETVWTEQKTFVYSCNEEKAVIIGSALGESFYVNTSITIEYDGCCFIDLKIMAKGLSVQEVFGLSNFQKPDYEIKEFSVEIPLKKTLAKFYHYFPLCKVHYFDGTVKTPEDFNGGEFIKSVKMPFLPIIWVGDESRGLNVFAENDKNRKYDENDAIEIIDGQNVTVKLNLLNARPDFWQENDPCPQYRYSPITFSFGLNATPVKPYPANPYPRKILHIDCFKKVLPDYLDFLSNPVVEGESEIGFDRIKRLGVTTLFLHEKWNMLQNFWEMPEETERQTRIIVEECHKRGIGVVPYFGFELSSLNPLWNEYAESSLVKSEDGRYKGGWYRVPRQRDYVVCYNGAWGDKYADGVIKLIEKMDFDGIYLDSTLLPFSCANEAHGCGYRDENGKLHSTYPLVAIRNMMKKIYSFVNERGGIVNAHLSGCMNGVSVGFTHLIWNGEDIQITIKNKGFDCVPIDYFLTEYTGRNMGVPNELLCYEFENVWTYKDSLCLALPHGVMPRPNDIGKPLEVTSRLWEIFDDFDISDASFHPYFKDGQTPFTGAPEKVIISYYEKPNGKKLVFIANPDVQTKKADIFSPLFQGNSVTELYSQNVLPVANGTLSVSLDKFDCLILLLG